MTLSTVSMAKILLPLVILGIGWWKFHEKLRKDMLLFFSVLMMWFGLAANILANFLSGSPINQVWQFIAYTVIFSLFSAVIYLYISKILCARDNSGLINQPENLNDTLGYIIAPVIVAAILLIVFYQKDIFPFGEGTVECNDMGQLVIPVYYHWYDVMHGESALFFNWNEFLGTNMSMIVSSEGLLNPTSLLLYIVPRDKIMEYMSLFIMIKMMACSVTMFHALARLFPGTVTSKWKIILAVLYAFNGFILQYGNFTPFLDPAMMFPLVALGAKYLLDGQGALVYIISLACCCTASFYTAAMILLFVFLSSGLYIFLMLETDHRRKSILSLGFGTVLSVGLSGFTALPFLRQMAESARLNSSKDKIQTFVDIITKLNVSDQQKWRMLMGLLPIIAIIIAGFLRSKKISHKKLFMLGCIGIAVLPIYFENINLFWHGGSYVLFPMRFGYMAAFVVICCGASFLEEVGAASPQSGHKWTQLLLVPAGSILGFYVLNSIKTKNFSGNYNTKLFIWSCLAEFVIFAIIAYIILSKKQKMMFPVLAIFIMCHAFWGSMFFIAPDSTLKFSNREQNGLYIAPSLTLRENEQLPSSPLARVKNVDTTLNANYPFIMQKAALSNWTHSLSSSQQKGFQNLGYSINYTRVLDAGGTLFTDALMNVQRIIQKQGVRNLPYKYLGQTGEYEIYETGIQLPLGIPIVSDTPMSELESADPFVNQNLIFQQFTGDANLIEEIVTNGEPVGSEISDFVRTENEISFQLNVSGSKLLYYRGYEGDESVSILLNGDAVPIPSIGAEKSTSYPQKFNNNVIEVAYLNDQVVDVKLQMSNSSNSKKTGNRATFALLDCDKLGLFAVQAEGVVSDISYGKSSLSFISNSASNQTVFLPISYEEGWRCEIDGKKVDTVKLFSNFLGITVPSGESRIELKFIPKGLLPGICTSVLSAIGFILYLALKQSDQVFHLLKMDSLEAIVAAVYEFILVAVTILIYVVPILATLFFYKILGW